MDHLTEILVGLADRKVDFVVGGGVAAVLHGVERVTMALDVAVRREPANLRRFLDAMKDMGLEPKMPVPAEILVEEANVRALLEQKGALVFSFRDPRDPIRVVDLFIKPELSYEALTPGSVSVDLRGRSIRVVSKKRLLAIKQSVKPMRPKDELDIAALRAMIESQDD